MFAKLYVLALVIALAMDGLWLGVIAKSFYAKQIGFLMPEQMNWIAAGLVYVVMIAGLTWFVIVPAAAQHSWTNALMFGAMFGFVVYATYDFTNLATIKNWPIMMTVIDIAWGAVLGAVVSAITVAIAAR